MFLSTVNYNHGSINKYFVITFREYSRNNNHKLVVTVVVPSGRFVTNDVRLTTNSKDFMTNESEKDSLILL